MESACSGESNTARRASRADGSETTQRLATQRTETVASEVKRLHACIMYMSMQAYQTASSLLSALPVLVLSLDCVFLPRRRDDCKYREACTAAVLPYRQSYRIN
jgi:hypothetical protein